MLHSRNDTPVANVIHSYFISIEKLDEAIFVYQHIAF